MLKVSFEAGLVTPASGGAFSWSGTSKALTWSRADSTFTAFPFAVLDPAQYGSLPPMTESDYELKVILTDDTEAKELRREARTFDLPIELQSRARSCSSASAPAVQAYASKTPSTSGFNLGLHGANRPRRALWHRIDPRRYFPSSSTLLAVGFKVVQGAHFFAAIVKREKERDPPSSHSPAEPFKQSPASYFICFPIHRSPFFRRSPSSLAFFILFTPVESDEPPAAYVIATARAAASSPQRLSQCPLDGVQGCTGGVPLVATSRAPYRITRPLGTSSAAVEGSARQPDFASRPFAHFCAEYCLVSRPLQQELAGRSDPNYVYIERIGRDAHYVIALTRAAASLSPLHFKQSGSRLRRGRAIGSHRSAQPCGNTRCLGLRRKERDTAVIPYAS
ncbi:hypothetical protein M422DRAFT_247191 [Sphaerobolus stellatus SS14]|nr:hypothetical protein M422DRAFT_247191 [Sphaerobolus stellatus SS14]